MFVDGWWRDVVLDTFLPCLIDPCGRDREGGSERFGASSSSSSPAASASSPAASASAPDPATATSRHDPHAISEENLATIRGTSEFLEAARFAARGPLPPGDRSPYAASVSRRLVGRCATTDDLAYSKARGGQLWVPLLEKAYAKVHGSYRAISGGHVAEAFLDLTGSPTVVYDLHSQDFEPRRFWADLMRYRRRRLPMGCGTSASAAGIVGMHAYSLLDVREVRDVGVGFFRDQMERGAMGNVSGFTEFDGTVRLLRIRNPHGKGEWRGDFSDGSDKWRQLLAHRGSRLGRDGDPCDGVPPIGSSPALERTMKDDGTFWIDYDHFLMGFSNVDVVLAFEGNHAKSFASNFPPKKSNHRCARAFRVSLVEEQPGLPANDRVEIYVMGIQKTRRGACQGRSDRKKSYKVCDLGILIGTHRDGGRSAFEEPAKVGEGDGHAPFDSVDGCMFGFTRNGHYRLLLDRKSCRSMVVMPISFGHPAATDKELSFVLRFVADAPVLITELSEAPRMDITMQKLMFTDGKVGHNADVVGTSRHRGVQGSKKLLLEDIEGKRQYGEPRFRVFQIDYLGGDGGTVFVYFAVNDDLLRRRGIAKFSLSLSVEANCKGMMCRTEHGLPQHETVSKGKKFEAAWRRYTCSYTDLRRSRLLMVLVQSGVSTQMGRVKVEVDRREKENSTSETNGMASFLGLTSPPLKQSTGSDYDTNGIFTELPFEIPTMFSASAACSGGDGSLIDLVGGGGGARADVADLELERALEMSRDEAKPFASAADPDPDVQMAITASLRDARRAVGERDLSSPTFHQEIELAMARSLEEDSKPPGEAIVVIDCEGSDPERVTDGNGSGARDVGGKGTERDAAVVEIEIEIGPDEKRRRAAEAALKRFSM